VIQLKRQIVSINEITPYVRLVGEFGGVSGFVERNRIFYDHLLFHVLSGKGRVNVGTDSFHAEPGDVFLIRPGVVYSAKADKHDPYVRQFVQFDFIYRGNYDDLPVDVVFPKIPQSEKVRPTPVFEEGLNLPVRSEMRDNPAIKRLFSGIFEEMYHKKPAFQLAVKAFLLQIILQIHRKALGVDSMEGETLETLPDVVAEGKKFIENNFRRKLSLKEIARRGHVSAVYFERIFKKTLGYTPMGYVLRLRIQLARELIVNTKKTIDSIANEAGFNNAYYFSRVFKKIVGVCPTEYRKLVRSGNSWLPFLADEMKEGYPTGTIIFAQGESSKF